MYKHLLTITYMDKHLQKLTYTIVETFTKRNLHVFKLICTYTMTIRLFVHTSIVNIIASYL